MPTTRIDLTECARRAGYTPNKSGRESVRRLLLDTDAKREALDYLILAGRATVDEAAFTAAFDAELERRRTAGSPAKNFGAYARKGLKRDQRARVFRREKEAEARKAAAKPTRKRPAA